MLCPYCQDPGADIIRKGFYPRRVGRAARVQRLACKPCGRRFSVDVGELSYREKKPHVDQPLFRLLCAGVSQRGAARILGVHPVTVARKLCRLGTKAKARLRDSVGSGCYGPCVVFDEMETFEHSKCKPLAIAVVVEQGSRRIIAAEVASMPAKGPLAALARRRYGYRQDDRAKALRAIMQEVARANPQVAELRSDECPRYPRLVRQCFPRAEHKTYLGRRGCVVGQGELKAGGFDPLFSLNHTCAMFRDRLKRLSRRTWCTTKRPDRLQLLVDLYAWYHNETLGGAGRLVSV